MRFTIAKSEDASAQWLHSSHYYWTLPCSLLNSNCPLSAQLLTFHKYLLFNQVIKNFKQKDDENFSLFQCLRNLCSL